MDKGPRLRPESDTIGRSELLEHAIARANDSIAIMELTDDPVVPVRIVYANESLERLTGYSAQELLDPANPLLQAQAPNRALFEERFEAIRAGKELRFEAELGGKHRATWAEIRWSPLRAKSGRVSHYVAVLRDITRRREADAERDLLYRAIEESEDYVVVYDAVPPSRGGPYVTYANGAFRHAMGYDARQIVGMSYRQFVSLENDQRALDHLSEMLERSHLVEKEVRLVRADGSTFWIEFSAHPVHSEGIEDHWFVVARDITARRRAVAQHSLLARTLDALPLPIEISRLVDGNVLLVFRNHASGEGSLLANEGEIRRLMEDGAREERRGSGDVSLIPLPNHAGIVDAVVCIAERRSGA